MWMPAKHVVLRAALLSGFLGSVMACSSEPRTVVEAAPRVEAASLAAPVVADAPAPPEPRPEPRAANVAQQIRAGTTAPAKPASDGLPELVYICPMPEDAEIVADKPGLCPKCGMTLQPVRITLAYSCLNNTALMQETPGTCRTDGTDLVPVSASLFWTCAGSDNKELNPGKCPDGRDRVKRFEPRPHGDHNPRHGGQLFMADDAWHHIEGTYPSAGLFRVFFYDDWTKPLAPKGFTARAVVKDAGGKEIATLPLRAGRISNTMDARIPNAGLTLIASLRVRFKASEPEKLFDFQFAAYTKEPAAPAPTITAAPAAPAPARSVSASPAPARQAASTPPPAPATEQAAASSFTLPPPQPQLELMSPIIPQEDPIPPTSKEILAELAAKSEQLAQEIAEGAPLGQLWVPALRTKNLAVALVTSHLGEIPSQQRATAENAANQLLRAAWAIDNFGDLGDKEKIVAAHEVLASAARDLRAAYDTVR